MKRLFQSMISKLRFPSSYFLSTPLFTDDESFVQMGTSIPSTFNPTSFLSYLPPRPLFIGGSSRYPPLHQCRSFPLLTYPFTPIRYGWRGGWASFDRGGLFLRIILEEEWDGWVVEGWCVGWYDVVVVVSSTVFRLWCCFLAWLVGWLMIMKLN